MDERQASDSLDGLLQLFVAYVDGHAGLQDMVSKWHWDHQWQQHYWKFTLPELHAFCLQNFAMTVPESYPLFRQQLFNTPFNDTLSNHQARVDIVDNQEKVDLSVYALNCRPAW